MPGPPWRLDAPTALEARALLLDLERLEFDRFTIVGNYLRFDERTRNSLKDFRQRVLSTFQRHGTEPGNFLLWGAPGSGKTYLVQQIAALLGSTIQYREINLAQHDEAGFREALREIEHTSAPLLCLIDEVDAKPTESWPYESLLPLLEPPKPRSSPSAVVLAGSGGRGLEELRERIRIRPKGSDLLTRIPAGNEFVIPSLGVGDRMVVSAVQLSLAANAEGRPIREVEKLALYYVAVHPTLSSARQLRSLSSQTAQRIPTGEDRIRYDNLFEAGNAENKEFWQASEPIREGLADSFIHVTASSRSAAEPRHPATKPEVMVQATLDPAPTGKRIAVLPFANMSPDPNDAFFADGLTEELISELSKVAGLRVIARTSVMRYRGTTKGVSEIGRELRVGSVVEGSVRRAGNRIRVTPQLIDTSTEEHLWSEKYDRELVDVFAIQSEIAREVSTALHVRLPSSPGTAPRTAPNLNAFKAYLKGRHLWNRRTDDHVRAALTLFEEALRIDPHFAEASSGIADCYSILVDRGSISAHEGNEKARIAAERAIQLDETNAEAHASLGLSLQRNQDWAAAEREFRRAIELNPMYASAHQWLYMQLISMGREAEAVQELDRAEDADPLSPIILFHRACHLWIIGKDSETLAGLNRASEMGGELDFAGFYKLVFYATHSMPAEALELSRRMTAMGQRPYGEATEMMVHAILGQRDEAYRELRQLTEAAKVRYVSAFGIAWACGAMGDADGFFEWALKAAEERARSPFEFVCFPLFAKMRADPRFQLYLRRVGISGGSASKSGPAEH